MRPGRAVALAASLFLPVLAAVTLLSEHVPVWVRPWIAPVAAGVPLLVIKAVARRRPPPVEPPRAPRQADPDAGRAIPPHGRALLIAHLAFCVLLVALLSIDLTLGRRWMLARAGLTDEDGPTWYRMTFVVVSSMVLTLAAITTLRQAHLLREALAMARTDRLTRWSGTVTSSRDGAVTLDAVRVDHPAQRRAVRFKEPGLPIDPLRPGDVLILRGSPRRGGWVIVTDGFRSRWQQLTLQQFSRGS